MKFLAMIWYALFAERSPEMEAREKLRQAQLDLVENEANLEYYSASVPMLRARIVRIQRDLTRDGDKLRNGNDSSGESGAQSSVIPRSLRSAQ